MFSSKRAAQEIGGDTAKTAIRELFQKNGWNLAITGDFGVAMHPAMLTWWEEARVTRVHPFSQEDKASQLPL